MLFQVFDTFEDLSQTAYKYLNSKQDECNEKYLINEHQKWFYDQETSLLSFSDNGKDCVRFIFESVGSISLLSNTWLWAWANDTILKNTTEQLDSVKQYGLRNGFIKLFEEKWEADIYDGWEMTAISAYLLNAIGAYRIPNDEENIFHFKLLMSVEYLDELGIEKLKLNRITGRTSE